MTLTIKNKKIELLAPAGNFESLIYAVENGADAVYLGGKDFNARTSAQNFDDEEIKKAVEYCHLRNVKVYLTMNTLISDHELKSALNYAEFCYFHNIDAIIIQDIGFAKILKDYIPDAEIHASTQMTINNIDTVKELNKIGFKRTVLSRELSVQEIEFINKNTDCETEVFIHGALCISYSGQCLLSSLVGGRSGNRGNCAQPCRLPYKLFNKTKNKYETESKYLLSPSDLCTLPLIEKIIKSGVTSLKIEGRMKKPEYVSSVVRIYRKTIDNYLMNNNNNYSEKDILHLKQAFNRNFTSGYISNETNIDIMNHEKPDNKGIPVAQTIEFKNNKLKIKLLESLYCNDGLEAYYNNNSVGCRVEYIEKDGIRIKEAEKDDVVTINFKYPVPPNIVLNKTYSKNFEDIEKLLSKTNTKKVYVKGSFKAKINESPRFEINYKDYIIVETSDIICEKAVNVPTSIERIETQINKTGNTPFVFENLNINCDENLSIPISEINRMRRSIFEKLEKKLLEKKQFVIPEKLSIKIPELFDYDNIPIELSAKVVNLEQLNALMETNIKDIYFEDIENFEKASILGKTKNIIPVIPVFRTSENKEEIEAIIKNCNHLMGTSIGDSVFINSTRTVDCDFNLNVFNFKTMEFLKEKGFRKITYSHELNFSQLKNINQYFNGNIVVYGKVPVMHMKYCPITNILNNNVKNCGLCQKNEYYLEDRIGEHLPILKSYRCYTKIYNPKTLFLYDDIPTLLENNFKNFRLDFTTETPEEIKNIYEEYLNIIHTKEQNEVFKENFKIKGITRGYFNKR